MEDEEEGRKAKGDVRVGGVNYSSSERQTMVADLITKVELIEDY